MFGKNVKSQNGVEGPVHEIGVVGGIEENDIELLPARGQECDAVALHHPGIVLEGGDLEIFFQQRYGITAHFHEGTMAGAAGEGLNAQLTGSTEEIENFAVRDLKLDDIVKGLLHLVGGGAGVHTLKLF
jgi:hypothetical protein